MFIQREFKLMGGRTDLQYVSSVDSKGRPNGYDKKKEYALDLTDWQAVRVIASFNFIGCKYHTIY